MIQKIQKGVTAAALAASYKNIKSMKLYDGVVTSANNDDLAAFIKSRLVP